MMRKVETKSRFSEASGNARDIFVVIKYPKCEFWWSQDKYKFTKHHLSVHFKWVSFMVYKLYFNKTVQNSQK